MRFQGNGPLMAFILRAALLVCVARWFVVSDSLQAQGSASPQANAPSEALRYEVVSIKSYAPGTGDGIWRFLPDGFDYVGITLEPLITYAYEVREDQVSGLPGWVGSNYYAIHAKVDAGTAEAWKKLSPKQVTAQQELMVQALLADRCQFKAHWETKELPVYDLVIARGGLKMKEAPAGEKPGGMIREGSFTGQSTSMELLVINLSGWSGRAVVDKTGLGDKRFDFELKWSSDQQRAADPDNAGPSLFTALEEQLGLKLVPSKGPVQFLVIDHIERPSAN